jgi:hypothetical protein
MSEGIVIALISLVGTIISASIGAFATLKAVEFKAKVDKDLQPDASKIVLEKSHSNQQIKKPSHWKALGSHLLFGFGLFYVDKTIKRKWLYPIFILYTIFDIFMAGQQIQPFLSADFGATTFGISFGLYIISFVDVILTCEARRRQIQ